MWFGSVRARPTTHAVVGGGGCVVIRLFVDIGRSLLPLSDMMSPRYATHELNWKYGHNKGVAMMLLEVTHVLTVHTHARRSRRTIDVEVSTCPVTFELAARPARSPRLNLIPNTA